jgi:hypothetical protein
MSRVRVLVDKLQLQAATGEKYNQTAVIPMSAFYKLAALGEYLNIPRSRLAGMLLVEAIADAIDALPNDEERVVDFAEGSERMSARNFIAYKAHELEGYDDLYEKHVAEKKAAKPAVVPAPDGTEVA